MLFAATSFMAIAIYVCYRITFWRMHSLMNKGPAMPPPAISLQSTSQSASVIVCVDNTAHARAVVSAGTNLAGILNLPLTLLHVIEPGGEQTGRPDPIDWEFRRHHARQLLTRVCEDSALSAGKARLEVVEGELVQTICDYAASSPGSILVIGATGVMGSAGQREYQTHRRHTAEQVLEAGANLVLLVPIGQSVPGNPLAKIMVLTDGSDYAEAALSEAARLARKSNAELLLTHVVPRAGLTLFGPPEATDLDLLQQIDLRNEQASRTFLETTRRRCADYGIKVRNLCFKGDVRSMLLQAIAREKPGLVVAAACGQGGKHCHDLLLGGTAAYLLAHIAAPMMVVHPAAGRDKQPTRRIIQTRQPTSAFIT